MDLSNITISRADLPHFFSLLGNRGVVFGATVRKRTNGEVREFNGRVEEVDMENDLAVINETNDGGYRSVAFEGVQQLRAFGNKFDI